MQIFQAQKMHKRRPDGRTSRTQSWFGWAGGSFQHQHAPIAGKQIVSCLTTIISTFYPRFRSLWPWPPLQQSPRATRTNYTFTSTSRRPTSTTASSTSTRAARATSTRKTPRASTPAPTSSGKRRPGPTWTGERGSERGSNDLREVSHF